MGGESEERGLLSRYRWRRLAAWLIDLVLVTLVVALAVGERALMPDPRSAFSIAVISAIVGAVYFFGFAALKRTPGLALVRGSIRASGTGRIASAAIFGAMFLPLGAALLVLDPVYDVFGSMGAEVSV